MRAYSFIKICLPVLLISMLADSTIADDWPNWRGPQHNGISHEIRRDIDWSACDPNVLWEQQVGTGFSSIAVADGRLYTMGNSELAVGREAIAHDIVYCLDANTGESLWSHAYPSPLAPNSYEGGPSATPTIADSNVYTFSKHGMAYCLDANDGAVLWQNDLTANYAVRAPTWGFAGSLYVDANLVIFNAGTHGLALHAADGTLAWETGTDRSGYSTPVPFDFEQQHFLVLMGEKTFAAVHTQTGQVLWEHPWVTRYNANIPDPIVDSNLIFVSTGYDEGSALFDVATGYVRELWFQKNMQTFLNSSVLCQGYLYGPNDNGKAITCVERSTGNIIWTQGGFGNGSLILADGKLIILSQSGELCIAEASPDSYMEILRTRILTGRCWTVPVLANGKIYARNAAGNLVSVELMPYKEIELIAQWKLDEAEGSVAYDSIGGHDGTLYGEPVWQPAGGKVDGAIQFDGIDDYVSTPYIISPADGDFSVLSWIKDGAAGQVILSQESGANWLMADSVNGALKTDLRESGTPGRFPNPSVSPLTSLAIITDGDWHQVGFVRNSSYRILYVDGIEVARDTVVELEASGQGLYIGTSCSMEQGTFWSGLIDDVRIYDGAMTADQIAGLSL